MTTTQITTLTIQGICLLICLGALIYQLHNYRKVKKQLKQREEEIKNQPVRYDYFFKPFPTKEHIIKTACGLGYTQRRIAKIVGLSQSTVFRIMRKHGWKKNIIKGKE